MKLIHYEDLWEKAEQFHKENSSLNETIDDIIYELTLKIGLYKAIIQKSEISEEDKKEAKSRLFGEILLTTTKLSLKENINVYEVLQNILMENLNSS